jgi:hypothetical protein
MSSLPVLQQIHKNSIYHSALAKGTKIGDANSKRNNITKYMEIKTGGNIPFIFYVAVLCLHFLSCKLKSTKPYFIKRKTHLSTQIYLQSINI